MLIITLYTKMSEYTQKTVAISSPMSLTFHIPQSHFTRSGKAARVNSAVEAPSLDCAIKVTDMGRGVAMSVTGGCPR